MHTAIAGIEAEVVQPSSTRAAQNVRAVDTDNVRESGAPMLAGIVVETVPGAAQRLWLRLLQLSGVTLTIARDHHRVSARIERPSAAARDEITQALLDCDEDIVSVSASLVTAAGPAA